MTTNCRPFASPRQLLVSHGSVQPCPPCPLRARIFGFISKGVETVWFCPVLASPPAGPLDFSEPFCAFSVLGQASWNANAAPFVATSPRVTGPIPCRSRSSRNKKKKSGGTLICPTAVGGEQHPDIWTLTRVCLQKNA